MEDLIDLASKRMMEAAASRILHRFEFPVISNGSITEPVLMEMTRLGKAEPIQWPCAVVITIRTKSPNRIMGDIVKGILSRLEASRLLPENRIRQIGACRLSSNEETVELYIATLDD